MALVHKDRVKETSTTTGTGTYTLAGAVTGFQSFSAIGNGNTCYYCATDGTNWEVGVGTYTSSGTTLARTSILASSNAGSAVSWSAGTRTIFCTPAAAKFLSSDEIAAAYAPLAGSVSQAFSVASLELGHASDTTLTRSAAGKLDVEGHTVLTDDEVAQTISGGARITVYDNGTKSSGTFTPDPGNCAHQKYTNNGAHTLAPGTNQGSYWLDITNGASAGAITTSGWTKVVGDSFTTTNGNKFACVAHISDLGSLLIVQAMQ